MRITTPRLLVRDLPPRAGSRVARFHAAHWQTHREWEPLREHSYFTRPTQRHILRVEGRNPSMLHLWLLLRDEGLSAGFTGPSWQKLPIIGSVTLSGIIRGAFESCYLGYKLQPELYRRGLMREALVGVIDYAFREMALHRIEANVMPRNEPSAGLLRSLGFRDEGVSRSYLQIQGRWEDHRHYVLLATDAWPKNRSGY